MTKDQAHRARWEGIVQTAVFIGALLVLIAVLYASVVVQRGRQEVAQRQETAQVAATVARRAVPPPTDAAYPAPGSAPTRSSYPQPDGRAAPADRPAAPTPSAPSDYPLPSPTEAAP